jgi:hypothetical protein
MQKFKLKKKSSFGYKGQIYHRGDIIEMSDEDAKMHAGVDFLEKVETSKKPAPIETPETVVPNTSDMLPSESSASKKARK